MTGTKKRLRVVAYIRVSTVEQARHGESLSNATASHLDGTWNWPTPSWSTRFPTTASQGRASIEKASRKSCDGCGPTKSMASACLDSIE